MQFDIFPEFRLFNADQLQNWTKKHSARSKITNLRLALGYEPTLKLVRLQSLDAISFEEGTYAPVQRRGQWIIIDDNYMES